jgi:phytoene dehydrogenase-like protein
LPGNCISYQLDNTFAKQGYPENQPTPGGPGCVNAFKGRKWRLGSALKVHKTRTKTALNSNGLKELSAKTPTPTPLLDHMAQKAAIIGSGPNGLSAAITLARAGLDVTVFEAQPTIGGAASTGEVTLPGFHHDLGSSAYPMGAASPFFQSIPLAAHGLQWIEPDAPLAHPLDDGTAVMLEHDIAATAANLGRDGIAYRRLIRPLADRFDDLCGEILGPAIHLPSHPILLARFGVFAALPAALLARTVFRGQRARALFAGNAAHSVLPLDSPFSAAVGLVLSAAGHAKGWPIAASGAQSISNALASYLKALGGQVLTRRKVTSLAELQDYSTVLLDVSPRQFSQLGQNSLPANYLRSLDAYRYGPGAFKIDWALSEPIPWKARECLRAATVHVSGTLEETAASESAPWQGKLSEKPFVLVTQPSLFDPSRAPAGRHTAWGYCHVPNGYDGSEQRTVEIIESQVERFAPGFRDTILARKVWTTAAFESWNANLVGGDLSGGAMSIKQLLFRPTMSQYRAPYSGKGPRLYLASASTPPGGGVHGMCGYHAARAALADLRIESNIRL